MKSKWQRSKLILRQAQDGAVLKSIMYEQIMVSLSNHEIWNLTLI
jgi:hypothetical protein